MNQSLYFETSHKGLVSDEEGNIKIVETDTKSGDDSLQKVLEYENEIEMLENEIKADQSFLEKEIFIGKIFRPYLFLTILAFSSSSLLFNIVFAPIILFPCGLAFYCYINHCLNKEARNVKDSIRRNKNKLSKLEEDCSNYKSKCNYKVIEPCESVRDNDYTCELYDVSIHDGANTFDKPSGKVLTLSREINKN